jgi:hypothetical protein
MIICKDGCYAYTGETAAEAYSAYRDSLDDHNCLGPQELEWYQADELELNMTLVPKSKVATKKTRVKK